MCVGHIIYYIRENRFGWSKKSGVLCIVKCESPRHRDGQREKPLGTFSVMWSRQRCVCAHQDALLSARLYRDARPPQFDIIIIRGLEFPSAEREPGRAVGQHEICAPLVRLMHFQEHKVKSCAVTPKRREKYYAPLWHLILPPHGINVHDSAWFHIYLCLIGWV